MTEFNGRVAIVTGAGKGLGRAYATWLAKHGARVVVNNRAHPRRASSAEEVVEQIRRDGGVAIADHTAVESDDAGEQLVAAAMSAYGSVDIVVSNAGVMDTLAPIDQLNLADFRRMMEINFWGSVAPVSAALPHMCASGYGRIVMTVSTVGLFGQRQQAYYGASRSAIVGFARSLAIDARELPDVRVNMISPQGYTAMAKQFHATDYSELSAPEKVAPVVGWLCSEECDRSGLILHAGSGRVRRVQIVAGRPLDIVQDDVGSLWPALDDMTWFEEADYSSAAGNVLREGAEYSGLAEQR